MTLIRRGSAKQKHTARRAWLVAHPDRYEGVPGIHDDVTETGRIRLDALHVAMRDLDFFGATKVENQREAIRRLVSELRGENVGIGW